MQSRELQAAVKRALADFPFGIEERPGDREVATAVIEVAARGGAFTGAFQAQSGRIRQSSGGTLFSR